MINDDIVAKAEDEINPAPNAEPDSASDEPEKAEEPCGGECGPDCEHEDAREPTEEDFQRFIIESMKAMAERDELQDKYMRLAAEYDNFRKRSMKEKEAAYQDATAEAVSKFLPVFDNLERATLQHTEDAAYQKGIELIMRQYCEILEKLGVSVMEAEGAKFDPNLHEAVMHVEDESLGENEIAEVLQKGFIMGDKVIRHAIVKVAN